MGGCRRAMQHYTLGILGLLGLLLLWRSSALADGSAEVDIFPMTGAYRATHRADRDGVSIIDFAGDYNRLLPGGASNIEARAVVAQEFFRTHPDQYDFLVLFSTFEFDSGEATALHWGVQNTVQGIGIAPYNVAHLFGSTGRLLGYIDMAALSRHVLDAAQPRFEDTLAILGHEVLHQWSGRARFVNAQGQVSQALLGRNGSHWSDLLDTNASVLYGHRWRDNHDGTFSSEAIRKFFSPLDLYLAGLYRPEEVPPFVLIDSPDHDPTLLPQPALRLPGTAQVITIEQVIAAEGPRLPAAQQAQKTFRFAWILLTSPDAVVQTAQLSAITQLRNAFSQRFAVWTGGRGLVVHEAAVVSTATPGAPETLSGGTLRLEPAALEAALQAGLQWLRQQQRLDGTWQDKPATRLRDTSLALETLVRLDAAFTGQTSAVAWLQAQTPQSTDARARQVQALAAAGNEVSGPRAALLEMARAQGGWGPGAEHAAEPQDTALALAALASPDSPPASVLEPALLYLLRRQNADGGWGALDSGLSRVGVTTLVLQALHLFKRQVPVLDAAFAWLARQQQADGGFGEAASTVHETAQALQVSMALGGVQHIRAGEAAAYLLARQQTDGSWAGSTYSTALALGALKRLYFPNWRIEWDLSDGFEQALDGERLALRLSVRNDGQSPAPAGVVRLYAGEPASGAQPLAPDVVIPALAPGASVTLSIPWDTSGAAGLHTLVALVDPEQAQTEVSEQDNRVLRPFIVQPAPAGVELTAEALTVLPGQPDTLPTVLGITAVVRNLGLTGATQVRVHLHEVEQQRLVAEGTYDVPARSSIPVTFTELLHTPGRLTFSLSVDPDELILETNKANNTAQTTIETLPSVDVQVNPDDLVLTPQTVLRGAEVTFAVTLRNSGTSLSPPTTVRYVLTDGASTVEFPEHIVQIDPGGTLQRRLTWRATHSGQFTFTVQLDPAHLLPETQTQNNQASVTFAVGDLQGPNLAVHFQDVSLSPEPGLAGKALSITALVRNTGTVAASDVVVAFYDGDPGQGGQELARQTLPLLAPDTSTLVTVVWPRLPSRPSVLLFVHLDPEEQLAEFVETDNTAFRALEVRSLPDLALTPADIQLTPGFPARGQAVLVAARVHNLGQQPANQVTVRAFNGGVDGVQLGPDQLVSVPGESSTVVQWLWTPDASADLSSITVLLDPAQALDEQRTDNNLAHRSIAVQDGDVFVSQRYISPNGDGVQDSTRFFFRVAVPEPVEVVLLDQHGNLVRQLRAPTQERDGSVNWDGLDGQGRVVRDGSYRFQVRLPTGSSLGEAEVVVDTNRSSLLEAIGTPFGMLTNLTCRLGELKAFAVTEDESTIFLATTAAAAFAPGIYRMHGNGTAVTSLLPLQTHDSIYSFQIAPDGSLLAYIGRFPNLSTQDKVFVVQGDGSNLREVPLAQQPQELVALLSSTSELVLLVRERSAPFRQQLIAVSMFGGNQRLLYSAPNAFTGLLVGGLSPRRDALVLRVDNFDALSYYLVPLVSGAPQPLAAYAVNTLALEYFLPADIPWSPDGTRLALKHLERSADDTLTFSLTFVDTQGQLLRRVTLPLQGNERTCISLSSDNLVWSPDGTEVAFDLVHKGLDECRTGDIFAGGLYVLDTRSGALQQVLAFDDRSRRYREETRSGRLSWLQPERALVYGLLRDDVIAVLLEEQNRRVALGLTGQDGASSVETLRLSASGRQLFYRDHSAARNPQSACYQQGSTDEWSYRSLLNLTTDIQVTHTPEGRAILLQGTVSDRHLASYVLEYAVNHTPDTWHAIQPASSQVVVQDVLATWIPPAPGTYLVRLRATDLAGNQRQQLLRVVWTEQTRISDLSRSSAVFSPNGDQTLEDVRLQYRVLQPVHLTFDIVNEAGERVRRLQRDHATAGGIESVVWDGRDEYGLRLPDGLYLVQVDNVVLPLRLDSTPPAITLTLQSAYQPLVLPNVGAVVQVAPSLSWSIAEPHYHRAVIETATTERPDVWQVWRELGPPASGDGLLQEQPLALDGLDHRLFRLSADDMAGNRSLLQVGPVAPQLILEAAGNHRLNEPAQACFLSPRGVSELLACVQAQGGYYHPLALLPYAPLGALDVPESVQDRALSVSTPTLRFSLAESIGAGLTRVVVQYRPLTEAAWQEMELSQFLDQAVLPNQGTQPLPTRMDVLWDLPALSSNLLYVVRLKAIDTQQQAYVSNPLRLQIDHAVLLQGLLSEASTADRQTHHLPFLVQEAGKTGLWALNVSREALREVRLILQSPDDPRYQIAREAARVGAPGQVIIFAADLTACKSYEAYVLGSTLSGASIRSRTQRLQVPCLNLAVQVEVLTGGTCDAAPPQQVKIHLAPESRSGATLKLLTLARLDATGQEDVVFNVNRPTSVPLPYLEAAPPSRFIYDPVALNLALPGVLTLPYVYTYDTSALPEGRLELLVRLIDSQDTAIALPISIPLDRTPPTLTLSLPVAGARVCGLPLLGQDGQWRNVVTLDGSVADANGVHYTVQVGQQLVHDSRQLNSFATALGRPAQITPPFAPFHLPRQEGPLAQLLETQGEVTVQLAVFDWGGFQQCASRSFFVDGRLEAEAPTLSRTLFSPNGDGLADDVTLSYQVHEASYLDLRVHTATQDAHGQLQITGPAVQHIESMQALSAGSATADWDGRDASGSVVPDGWYGLLSVLTDACGNQQRYEVFVEVDTTPPQVVIEAPQPHTPLSLLVAVQGSVLDPHLSTYRLQVGGGTTPQTWAVLSTGTTSRASTVLAAWNTFGLSGPFVIQLNAQDQAGNSSRVEVPVTLTARLVLLNALNVTPSLFSPNGDGKREHVSLSLGLQSEVFLTVTVQNTAGLVLRTLASNQPRPAGITLLTWDGRQDSGIMAPDGVYTVLVRAVLAEAPTVTQEERLTVTLDTTPPQISLRRPAEGFVTALGQVQGSITDAHLSAYSVTLTDSPIGPQNVLLSSGSSPVTEAAMGSLHGLPEGIYTLTIEAHDAADNTARTRSTFVIDNTPPVLELLAPAAGSVLGRQQSPVSLRGTLTESHLARYQLHVGAGTEPLTWMELAHSSSAPDTEVLGLWDVTGFPDGPYTLRLLADDKAGLRTEKRLLLHVDQTPPSVAFTVPGEAALLTTTVPISGSVSDAHLATYRLELAAESTPTSWSLLGTGSTVAQNQLLLHWRDLPPDGTYSLRLTALDRAGNTAATLRQVHVDTTPPARLEGLSATRSPQQVRLTWQASPAADLAGYTVYRDGQRLTATLLGVAEYVDTNVSEGRYTYTVSASDRAGLESAPSLPATVSVDYTPPQVSLSLPASGSTVSGILEITGTAYSAHDFKNYRLLLGTGTTPLSWQLLRQSPVPVQADVLGQWTTLGLSEGAQYSIKLEGEDLSGNIGSAQVVVRIDNQGPAAPTGLSAVASGAQVQLTWQANAETDLLGYLVYRNARLLTANGSASGDLRTLAVRTASYTEQAVPDGSHTYTVVALDQAGNASTPSTPALAQVNNRAPQAQLLHPRPGTVFDGTLALLASVADADVAQVQFHYKTPAAPTWLLLSTDSTPPYEATFDPAALGLSFATYQLRALATDTSNRSDPAPGVLSVTYADRTRPGPLQGLVAQVDGDTVRMQWSAAGETDLAGYHVERQQDSAAPVRLSGLPLHATSYVDSRLAEATYRYTVVALDTHNNLSDPASTAPLLVYTPFLQTPHTPTTATRLNLSGQGAALATVHGQVTTAQGNRALPEVTADVSGHFVLPDISLAPGENFLLVQLTDPTGHRSKPATLTVVAAQMPSPPTGLAASALGTSVNLTWQANPETDIAGYRLWRNGIPVLADLAISDGTLSAGGSLLTWPVPRQVTRVQVQWSASPASAFDLEAWSGQHWVTLAAMRDNQQHQNVINLATAYRTTQLRLVLPGQAGTPLPGSLTLAGLYAPLIMGTDYHENLPDGHYSYHLTAVNAYGLESLPSVPLPVALGDVLPPESVVLSASVLNSVVQLQWTPSPSPDAAHYAIARNGSLLTSVAGSAPLHYVDAGLANGTYTYTVSVIDQVGNASAASNQVSVAVTAPLPPAPHSLQVQPVDAGGMLTLQWSSAGAGQTGYRVLRSLSAGGPYTALAELTASSMTDTGLLLGTTYYYVVQSLDALGNASAFSAEVAGTPRDRLPPAAPRLYFPTVPGRPFSTTEPESSLLGQAEPGAEVVLFAQGQRIASTTARSSATLLDIALASSGRPLLSPDGRYVAFVEAAGATPPGGVLQRLRLYDSLTERFDEVAMVRATTFLRWTSDSTVLLFNEQDLQYYTSFIQAYDLAAKHLQRLTDPLRTDMRAAIPSPDGRQRLFYGAVLGRYGLWLQNVGSTDYTLLREVPIAGAIEGSSIQWSPDGAFLAYRRQGSYEIVSLATGQSTQVDTQASVYAPSWAPDGQSLLYAVLTPALQMRLYDLPSRSIHPLGAGLAPQWSADGQSILYIAPTTGALLQYDRATGLETTLLHNSTLLPETLYVAPTGFIGVLQTVAAPQSIYRRIELAGRFTLTHVKLTPGENTFIASAIDAAGNSSAASEALTLTYSSGPQADLALSVEDLVVFPAIPAVGTATRISITVRNNGDLAAAATTLSLVVLDPAGQSTVLLNHADFSALQVGESHTRDTLWTPSGASGRYTLVAVVDPDDLLHEGSETNNVVLQELLVASQAAPSVTVSTDALLYQGAQPVQISAEVHNAGTAWSGRVLLSVTDVAGFVLQTLQDTSIVALGYGDSFVLQATWDSGDTLAGAYQVHAQLLDQQDGVLDSATAPFNLAARSVLGVTVSSDRSTYSANTDVRLLGTLTYSAGNHLLSAVTMQLRIVDANALTLASQTGLVGDLLPGATVSLVLDWNTGELAPGQYQVLFDVTQDGQTLAQAQSALSIVPGGLRVSGQLILAEAAPVPGRIQTATATLRNLGNSPLLRVPVIFSLHDMVTGRVRDEQRLLTDLAVAGQATLQAEFATATLALQSYRVLVQLDLADGQAGEVRQTLASQNFVVSDRAGPQITVLTPSLHGFLSQTGSVTLLVQDDFSQVARTEWRLDGGLWQPVPQPDRGSSRYEATLPSLTAGQHSLEVRATDSLGNVTLSPAVVFHVDATPPQISITGVRDGVAYAGAVTPVIRITEEHPAETRVTLNGTPFESGTTVSAENTYQLAVRASDQAGNQAGTVLHFLIDSTPPVITVQGVQDNTVYDSAPYVYQVVATDPDGDPLWYTLPVAPPDMRIDAQGRLLWWPQQPGEYDVSVRVEDVYGTAATQAYRLTVTVTNLTPAILSAPPDQAIVQEPYVYAVEAVDPNGDLLTYSLEVAPPDMQIEALTGLLTWTPMSAGDVQVRIRVQDIYAATATQVYTLQVRSAP